MWRMWISLLFAYPKCSVKLAYSVCHSVKAISHILFNLNSNKINTISVFNPVPCPSACTAAVSMCSLSNSKLTEDEKLQEYLNDSDPVQTYSVAISCCQM